MFMEHCAVQTWLWCVQKTRLQNTFRCNTGQVFFLRYLDCCILRHVNIYFLCVFMVNLWFKNSTIFRLIGQETSALCRIFWSYFLGLLPLPLGHHLKFFHLSFWLCVKQFCICWVDIHIILFGELMLKFIHQLIF